MVSNKNNPIQTQKVLPDHLVVEKVLNGETELFEILMRRYNELLYRTVRSYINQDSDVEDIMQDAYVKAYQKLYQFKNESTFSTWLVRIGINEALQRKRKFKNYRTTALEHESGILQIADTSVMNPENSTIYKESVAFIEKAVDTLPQKYKIIYMLREVEGMEISEISKTLDLTVSNVKVRLFRARNMIKDYIFTTTNTKNIFEFGNHKCDCLVELVLKRIQGMEFS
ncbi:RNA polymerase, sigma-24 subunit, ECF subfamily [Allomuricauda ruestringensis DSM 13258]|uniref:RNA polymerase, sigma-24 subunit, ECF subfamily n=1 Tax=Allomuricauda ruestringensis (strain DSM 13258 / CIP 107369 / LMG 19739 / B1) TaxID=886377 RepID=G2PQP3_ALLRU|nr:RNA polymerase sigma factor [Allomuricauda ruestringensis]AEM71680.1 RNA polymerase, sigma-24 subunit, ECF subfamily [Allomuricauda ruestringensis DSM 13258]